MNTAHRALTLALLACLFSAPALASDRKLEKRGERAAQAADRGDLEKAVKLGLKVLDQDPQNLDAAWAVGVSMATLLQSNMVGPEDEAEIRAGTLALLALAGADPKHAVRAATARRLQSELAGDRVLLPRVEPECPSSAVQDFNQAETLFGQRRMSEARAYYQRALDACPTNATWLVYLGDTWMDEDRAKALAAYEQALVLMPCHAQAHRFAADVLMRTETEEEQTQGRAHAYAAVACDPTYEEAWVTLGGYLAATEQRALPVWSRSTDVEGWAIYQDSLNQTADEDPLRRREQAIRAVLRQGVPQTPLWQNISQASGQGWLTEAILFDLLDPDLVQVYLDQRAAREQRLIGYVEDLHVVP